MKSPLLTLTVFFILTSVHCFAQNSGRNINKDNVAIKGYDPVSYFNAEKPAVGNKEFTSEYNKVNYWFVNEANKALFLDNPTKYEPKYGGWCAYAMGIDGSKVKIDPETFKIIDGGLYLFYNFRSTNTLTLWNNDEATLKSKADDFWANSVE